MKSPLRIEEMPITRWGVETYVYDIYTADGELIIESIDEEKIAKEIVKRFNIHDELAELIARNLVAWDTSKDKREGLLPEVYLTNKCLYKKLTGVEYSYLDAVKRFNIQI